MREVKKINDKKKVVRKGKSVDCDCVFKVWLLNSQRILKRPKTPEFLDYLKNVCLFM